MPQSPPGGASQSRLRSGGAGRAARPQPQSQPIEVEVDDRRRIKGQRLADDEAANDRDAERLAKLAAHAEGEAQRQRAEQGRNVVIMIGRKRIIAAR